MISANYHSCLEIWIQCTTDTFAECIFFKTYIFRQIYDSLQ